MSFNYCGYLRTAGGVKPLRFCKSFSRTWHLFRISSGSLKGINLSVAHEEGHVGRVQSLGYEKSPYCSGMKQEAGFTALLVKVLHSFTS